MHEGPDTRKKKVQNKNLTWQEAERARGGAQHIREAERAHAARSTEYLLRLY